MRLPKILFVFVLTMLIPFSVFSGDKNFYYFNGQKLEVIWRQSCEKGLTDFVKVYNTDKTEKYIIIQRRDDLRSFLVKGKEGNTYHIVDEKGNITNLTARKWLEELAQFSPGVSLWLTVDKEKRVLCGCEINVLNATE